MPRFVFPQIIPESLVFRQSLVVIRFGKVIDRIYIPNYDSFSKSLVLMTTDNDALAKKILLKNSIPSISDKALAFFLEDTDSTANIIRLLNDSSIGVISTEEYSEGLEQFLLETMKK